MSRRSLPDDQHIARVRIVENRWQEFHLLAKVKNRTIADYLGWLVTKELNRARRTEDRRAAKAEPVEEPAAEIWIPPWEE